MTGRVLVIRNWAKFQHYKDRNPPWIKLHFELLASRDWVLLDDASRVLAVVCMLVASRNAGVIDASEAGLEYLKRVAYLNTPPNLKPLIACGFLEHASAVLADASNLHTNARPEEETEAETETEQERSEPLGCAELARAIWPAIDPPATLKAKPLLAYTPEFEAFWRAYPRRVGKLGAFRAFTKACKALGEGAATGVLLTGAKALSEAVRGQEPRYTPHPATWLNDGCWDDEPPAPRSGPTGRSQFGMGG